MHLSNGQTTDKKKKKKGKEDMKVRRGAEGRGGRVMVDTSMD